MEDLRVRFGSLVAAHRKQRGWTQVQLAQHAGLGADMISRIETGASGARFQTVAKLAEALAIDPAELFSPDVDGSKLLRPKLTAITSRLAALSDTDLDWLDRVLVAVLRHR